jgi:hypothetical protein
VLVEPNIQNRVFESDVLVREKHTSDALVKKQLSCLTVARLDFRPVSLDNFVIR